MSPQHSVSDTMLARQPWRRWSGRQLLLFIVETIVLAGAIALLGGGEELPRPVQTGSRVISPVILLVGILVVLGWIAQRRRTSLN